MAMNMGIPIEPELFNHKLEPLSIEPTPYGIHIHRRKRWRID